MNVLIVYSHPEPKSFNHAMFDKACEVFTGEQDELRTSDLYAMGFDPVSSRDNFKTARNPEYLKLQLEEMHATETNGFSPVLEVEIQKLEWCDLMIWQFPLWWFGLPAALKGWVDRVFATGRIYGDGRMFDSGVMRGKRALLSLTIGGTADLYTRDALGDISDILKPVHRGMLNFVGFDVLAPNTVYAPARMTDAQRGHELELFGNRLAKISEESPIEIGQY